MIKVVVTKQSNYPVSSVKVKKILRDFLTKKGIVSDSIVEVVVVGKKKMLSIANKYLKEKRKAPHNVLSFTEDEIRGEFVYPPDGKIYLGKIVICYPQVFKEAKEEQVRIDDKVESLLKHSALHLLGEHHD